MKIGIPKEILPEQRVAVIPDIVSKMVKVGMEVHVQADAGTHAHIADAAYRDAGAQIASTAAALYQQAEVILKINPPDDSEINLFKDNTILIAALAPLRHLDLMNKLNKKNVAAFSLDQVPRIARAQTMDILSSMSNLAGYKSVILAADYLGKIFPMLTTAAGTLLPAKVIVIGAGVAGLQAIATARRLGGVVLAFDTRPAAAEQVKSLGANFVSLETTHEQSQDAGGYAKAQSAAFYAKEQEIIQQYLKDADVVITTALIPNQRAPILITEAMVKGMKAGSVIVDLAVEQQGNCEISEPGKIVSKYDVTLIGLLNLPSTLPVHASQLYSKNIFSFLNYIAPQIENKQFDLSDDIVKSCLLMQNGTIIHATLKQALEKKTP